MTLSSKSGGETNIHKARLHSSKVAVALGISYRIVDIWTHKGMVPVESHGSGHPRDYSYYDIHQLGLVRELHRGQNELEVIRLALKTFPTGFRSWGQIVSSYSLEYYGPIFMAVLCGGLHLPGQELPESPELKLATSGPELHQVLSSNLTSLTVDLAQLKNETDEGITSVLQRE